MKSSNDIPEVLAAAAAFVIPKKSSSTLVVEEFAALTSTSCIAVSCAVSSESVLVASLHIASDLALISAARSGLINAASMKLMVLSSVPAVPAISSLNMPATLRPPLAMSIIIFCASSTVIGSLAPTSSTSCSKFLISNPAAAIPLPDVASNCCIRSSNDAAVSTLCCAKFGSAMASSFSFPMTIVVKLWAMERDTASQV